MEIKKTRHGAYRAQQRRFSDERIAEIIEHPSRKYYQLNGAEVFIQARGRRKIYDVVIRGKEGIITTITAEGPKELRRLGIRYNWQTVRIDESINNNS